MKKFVVLLIICICLCSCVEKRKINYDKLENQEVKTFYNEDAYIVEGVPETVDVYIKDDILVDFPYVSVDLRDYEEGKNQKVKLKINIGTHFDYYIEPSIITVDIYEKVSKSFSITDKVARIVNLNNEYLVSAINNTVDIDSVVIRGKEADLDKIASVITKLDCSGVNGEGTYRLEVDFKALDENGEEISNVQIVAEARKLEIIAVKGR